MVLTSWDCRLASLWSKIETLHKKNACQRFKCTRVTNIVCRAAQSIKTQTCLIFHFSCAAYTSCFFRHIKIFDWSLLVIGEYALHPCGESEILTCHLVSKARSNWIFLACLGENDWNRRVCSSSLWWIRNLDFQKLIHSLCSLESFRGPSLGQPERNDPSGDKKITWLFQPTINSRLLRTQNFGRRSVCLRLVWPLVGLWPWGDH